MERQVKLLREGKASGRVTTGSSSQARAAAAKLKSLSTYVELPLDDMRDDLLESLEFN